MRILVAAMGRQKSGPEAALVTDYLSRAGKVGRSLGLSPFDLVELDDRKGGGKSAEANLLRKAVPQNARIVALDERGTLLTSPGFAERLAGWRDGGAQTTAFVIGGADGLDPDLVTEADLVLSFGKMVWPHMLARVMLAEQLYRAASILAGSPYHRV